MRSVKALKKIGYEFDREKGSYMILLQTVAPFRRVVAPYHKEVAAGTLRAIVKQTGLTVDQFKNLL